MSPHVSGYVTSMIECLSTYCAHEGPDPRVDPHVDGRVAFGHPLPADFALEGLGKLLNTINIIQRGLNPELEIEGFLLTMYDARLRLSNQVVDEVRKHFQQMEY